MRLLSLFLVCFCLLSCADTKPLNRYTNTNKKQGVWIEIIDSASVAFERVRYNEGIKEGKSEMYLKDNSIAVGKYHNNKKHGAWKYYKIKELLKIEYYTEGYVTRIEFIENGKVKNQVITDPTF